MEIADQEITRICVLCYESCDNYQAIDEFARRMLSVLELKPDLSLFGEPILCNECMKDIQRYFNFKSSCLNTENYINFIAKDKGRSNIDLIEVYLRNKSLSRDSISEEYIVCRLCIKLIKCDCSVSLSSEAKDVILLNISLRRYFSNMDFSITPDPVICMTCCDLLRNYLHFMEKGLGKKDEINGHCKTEVRKSEVQSNCVSLCVQDDVMKSEGDYFQLEEMPVTIWDDNCSKIEKECIDGIEMEIKSEECAIKEDPELDSDPQNSFRESPVVADPNDKSVFQKVTYLCLTCLFETEDDGDIEDHVTLHVTHIYRKVIYCHLCSYRSMVKFSMTRHMLSHETSFDATWHPCTLCNYMAETKKRLKQHMLTHTDVSILTMHRCPQCMYQTRHEESFIKHWSTHQRGRLVQLYMCPFCPFETDHKRMLFEHMRTAHDNLKPDELTPRTLQKVYTCKFCHFESEYLMTFQNHMLKHKKRPETNM